MATSKTLAPTNVTISIPAMTDAPDASVISNCLDKEADAINTLNSKLGNFLLTSGDFTANTGVTLTKQGNGGGRFILATISTQRTLCDIASLFVTNSGSISVLPFNDGTLGFTYTVNNDNGTINIKHATLTNSVGLTVIRLWGGITFERS